MPVKRQSGGEKARKEQWQPGSLGATRPKVWVRGHVPEEFLGWVESHAAHDNETKAMLSECCSEV